MILKYEVPCPLWRGIAPMLIIIVPEVTILGRALKENLGNFGQINVTLHHKTNKKSHGPVLCYG